MATQGLLSLDGDLLFLTAVTARDLGEEAIVNKFLPIVPEGAVLLNTLNISESCEHHYNGKGVIEGTTGLGANETDN